MIFLVTEDVHLPSQLIVSDKKHRTRLLTLSTVFLNDSKWNTLSMMKGFSCEMCSYCSASMISAVSLSTEMPCAASSSSALNSVWNALEMPWQRTFISLSP